MRSANASGMNNDHALNRMNEPLIHTRAIVLPMAGFNPDQQADVNRKIARNN